MMSASHPFAASPSQSSKPCGQDVTLHSPETHTVLTVSWMQVMSQEPQWFTSPEISCSHPFDASLSQSSNPWLQDATAHTPFVHAPTPFFGLQPFPQAPQLSVS